MCVNGDLRCNVAYVSLMPLYMASCVCLSHIDGDTTYCTTQISRTLPSIFEKIELLAKPTRFHMK